jgi:hypothetical protein
MYLKIRDSERVGETHGRRRQRTDIDVVLDRPGLRALHADGLRPWNVAVDNGLVGRVRFVFFVSLTGHLHVSVLHGGHRHRFQHRQETRPDRTDHRTAGHARRRPHRRRRCRRRYLELFLQFDTFRRLVRDVSRNYNIIIFRARAKSNSCRSWRFYKGTASVIC